MIDIATEIEALIGPNPIKESKWVKSMSTRMRVFNTQIFENVYNGHCKDNADMNYAYVEKTFNKLHATAYSDETISNVEYYDFCDQFRMNVIELYYKESRKFDVE